MKKLMKKLTQRVLSKWRLENTPIILSFSRGKIALAPDDILRDLSDKVHDKSRQVSISLAQQPSAFEWAFDATSGGDIYTVRVKSLAREPGDLVRDNEIEMSCSCPFWRYQGPEYHAHSEDYLYGSPQGTATKPDSRDPSGVNLVCKHGAAVLREVRDLIIEDK